MRNTASKIVHIYALLLMVVFPLFLTNAYYNIQESKLYFYLYSTITATVLVLACAVYGRITGKPWNPQVSITSGSGGQKNSDAQAKPSGSALLRASLLPADYFAVVFLLVTILSTLCSEWRYEAFWGNMGRQQGCFLWCWYLATYVLISRFYRVRQWHVDLFLLAGVIICVWGVMDCFWHSPIGWQMLHEGSEKAQDFSSTIGNVNVLTAYEGIYLLEASAMFIGEASGHASFRSLFYYIAACAAFMGLTCGCSDNAMVSVAVAICFLPFFAFRSLRSLTRYAGLLAGYLGTMLLTGWIGHREGVRIVTRWKWGELLELAMEHPELIQKLFLAALALTALLLAACVISARKKVHAGLPADGAEALPSGTASLSGTKQECSRTKQQCSGAEDHWRLTVPLRIIWTSLGILAACLLIYIFYDANHGGHPELYAPFRNFLVFDDAWGTHRGYNWRLLLRYFRDFPLAKKLIGSGPETYGIFTHVYDHYQMLDMFEETYDSPHNEWLQHLFSIGILGFIGYYGLVASALKEGFSLRFARGLSTDAGTGASEAMIPGAGASDTRAAGTGSPAMSGSKAAWIGEPGNIRLCGIAFAYALLVYTLQSFVNISIPIILPVVMLSIGICVSVGRQSRR